MKKRSLRVITLAVALLLLVLCAASCAAKPKALLTLDRDGTKVTFSVNLYELMLSRMKGMLVSGGYTANSISADKAEFWDYQDKLNGTDLQTLNEYYGQLILDNCRTYTAALWLFEKEGLTLSAEQLASVESRLSDVLNDHGNGSKTKLNAVLSNYGINYDLLKEIYLMEEKVTAVQNKLYGANASLVGPNVKNEFLSEYYVHFKQIFLPTYRYEYETDANGDDIYYVPESQKATVCYDTVHGFEAKDENGTPVTDRNGDTVYYTTKDGTRIAYDKEKGVRSYKLDSKGVAITKDMTTEEIAQLKEKADKLYQSLKGCTVEAFEAEMAKQNKEIPGEDIYTDGYYLRKTVDYAGLSAEYSYFSDIITAMDSMQDGDIAIITSNSAGYHIVMKYAPTEGAYDKEVNEPWFKDFHSALVEQLFLDECHSYFEEISVNFEILASATDIKNIGANFYF